MARIIFSGANLLDGDNPAQAGMNVAVEGETIAQVSEAPIAAGPEDRVIEMRGRTLMPGLICSHFHASYNGITIQPEPLGVERPENYLALVAANNLRNALHAGVTGVVSAGVNTGSIDADMCLAIAEGVIEGPRLLPGSRGMDSIGGYSDQENWWWRLGNRGAQLLCSGAEEFQRATRLEIKRGARMIKLNLSGGHAVPEHVGAMSLTRAELDAVIEAAHGRGAKVRAHVAWKNVLLEAVEAGLDVVDHGDQMDDECLDCMARHGVFWAPTAFFTAQMLSPESALALGTEEQLTTLRGEFDNVLRNIEEAERAGIPMLTGDDYGVIVLPHGRYAEELAFYVKTAGVAPLNVLRWATKNGGALMGGEIPTGQVKPGYYADLLVVDGDPSADIALLQDRAKLQAIVKGGAFVRDAL